METMETLCRRKSVRTYTGEAPTAEQMEAHFESSAGSARGNGPL